MKDSRDDDLEARIKGDPRRDPTDPPPPADGESPLPKVETVDSSASQRLPANASDLVQASAPLIAAAQAVDADPVRRKARPVVTSSDPRFPAVERAVDSGNWDELLAALGPRGEAGWLPPNLGLLYAIALKEKERADTANPDMTEIAIRCTAGVLGVDTTSPIALLVAKRLLRKNPIAWRERPAPRPTISILFILGGLLIGGTLSWLISFGYLHVTLHLP